MSVLIKGMQIPKNCAECPVALCGKYCRINQTYTTFKELPIRPDHCPLVELPKKHGRLIDADDVKSRMIPLSFSVQNWISEVELSNCRTVIKAEENK